MSYRINLSALTDTGRGRINNEDVLFTSSPNGSYHSRFPGLLLAVFDGMGGTHGGGKAAEIAAESLESDFRQVKTQHAEPNPEDKMKQMLYKAHQQIGQFVRNSHDYYNMGTTAVLAWLNNDYLHIAWCGDSRCYTVDEEHKLILQTDDHSLVWKAVINHELTPEQARLHPDNNIITQSLGSTSETPVPDYRKLPLQQAKKVMLCSDGLSDMVSAPVMEKLTRLAVAPDQLAGQLVHEANLAGGNDNITVIVADIDSEQ